MERRIWLGAHVRTIPFIIPDPDYIKKFVVRDGKTEHWFWPEGRGKRTHDSAGQAYLKWCVRPTAKTHMISWGRYNVVRTLFESVNPEARNLDFFNACGLSQCINPGHWARAAAAPDHYIASVPAPWSVVRTSTGQVEDRPIVLRLQDPSGTVHVARAAPPAPLVAVCGASLDPLAVVTTEAMVTCRGGC